MSVPQNFKNHARYVPLFHFVLGALVLANFIHVTLDLRYQTMDSVWAFVRGAALLVLYWYARAFPVSVQDRIIRLEMRLRVQQLAPDLAAHFDQLTPGQITALRFAGDDELASLMREVLEGKLAKPSDIKQRVQHWKPDTFRV